MRLDSHASVAEFASAPALLAEYASGHRVSKLRFSATADTVSLVALLADSPRLATWRLATPADLREEPRWFDLPRKASRIVDLAFTQRGNKLALVADGTPVHIVDFPALTLSAELGDPQQRSYSALAFCRDDQFLIVCGNSPAQADVFRVSDGAMCNRFWSGSLPAALAVHPESALIAETLSEQGGSQVRFAHLTELGVQPLAPGVSTYLDLAGIRWSPSGRAFAVVGGWETANVALYSFPRIRELWTFLAEPRSKANYSLDRDTPLFERVVFSPCGRALLAPTESGEVVALSAESGACIGKWKAHDGPVTAIEADPTSRFVVTAGADHTLRAWTMPFLSMPLLAPEHRTTAEFLSLAQPVELPIDEYAFDDLSNKLLDAMGEGDGSSP